MKEEKPRRRFSEKLLEDFMFYDKTKPKSLSAILLEKIRKHQEEQERLLEQESLLQEQKKRKQNLEQKKKQKQKKKKKKSFEK